MTPDPTRDGAADAPLDAADDPQTSRRPERPDADPERLCVATGERRKQSAMVRFVLGPENVLYPDVLARLPGRGVWVTARSDALETAIRKKAFSRGLKADVKLPDGLVETVHTLLLKRCQDTLGLAKRAGDLALGYDRVMAAIEGGMKPGALIEAGDGARDGRMKVYRRAKTLYANVEVNAALSSEELGMALGRATVIHALVKRGRMAKTWARDYRRLIGFRTAPEENWFSGSEV